MIIEKKAYEVRGAYSIGTFIGCGCLAAIWFFFAYRGWENAWNGVLENKIAYGFTVMIAILLAAAALASLWQMRRPAYRLELGADNIKLRRHELGSDRIKRIYVSEEDIPVIGVLPKKVGFVPNDYSFKFSKDSEPKLQELLGWAQANNVQVVHKKAERWL